MNEEDAVVCQLFELGARIAVSQWELRDVIGAILLAAAPRLLSKQPPCVVYSQFYAAGRPQQVGLLVFSSPWGQLRMPIGMFSDQAMQLISRITYRTAWLDDLEALAREDDQPSASEVVQKIQEAAAVFEIEIERAIEELLAWPINTEVIKDWRSKVAVCA